MAKIRLRYRKLSRNKKRFLKILLIATVSGISFILAEQIMQSFIPNMKPTYYAIAAELTSKTSNKVGQKTKEEAIKSVASGKTQSIVISGTILVSIAAMIRYLKKHPNTLFYGW